VAVGIAVLLSLPAGLPAAAALIQGLGRAQSVPSPQVLMRRALDSARVPHSGLAESTGTLGLPDLPQLSDVASVLGGSTRTRVWWADPTSWRVDVLTPTGEQGNYQAGVRKVMWDYEQSRLTEVIGASRIRLPRADDLLPPQAARRLLAGVGSQDQLQRLPGRPVVAGLRAAGLRIVPGDRRSTIGHIDVWLDPGRGLPLAIDVVSARGVTAMRSKFIELDLTKPQPSSLRVPSAPGVLHDATDAPDLATRIQRFDSGPLPDRIAGMASSVPIVGGTATYGTGLVKFVVVPLPGWLGTPVREAVRTGGGTELDFPTAGEGVLVGNGLVNLVVSRGPDQRTYLTVGLVSGELLTEAAADLLVMPGGWFG
jgi:hypothetical protein